MLKPPYSMELAVKLTLLGRIYPLYTHVHHTYGLSNAFDKSLSAFIHLRL